MLTQSDIDKVIAECVELGPGCPSINFDWFEPVVETASRIGVLGHDAVVLPVNPGGRDGYALVLTVNGVRFVSETLYFEEEWNEDWAHESLSESVLKLLTIALRVIREIEVARDTWYTVKGSIL